MKIHFSRCLIAAVMFGVSGEAFSNSIEEYRNTDTLHGLYEIRQEAVHFLDAHNKTTGENWQALEPNLKVIMPRCDVSLTAQWLPKSHGASGDNIVVTCAKPRDRSDPKDWTVFVPVKKAN